MGSRIIFAAPVSSTSFSSDSLFFFARPLSRVSLGGSSSKASRLRDSSGSPDCGDSTASSLGLFARAGDPSPGPFAIGRSVSQPRIERRFCGPDNQFLARRRASCSAVGISSSNLVKIFFFTISAAWSAMLQLTPQGDPQSFSTCERARGRGLVLSEFPAVVTPEILGRARFSTAFPLPVVRATKCSVLPSSSRRGHQREGRGT